MRMVTLMKKEYNCTVAKHNELPNIMIPPTTFYSAQAIRLILVQIGQSMMMHAHALAAVLNPDLDSQLA